MKTNQQILMEPLENIPYHASLDAKEVDTGDAANLNVEVKGSGNLPVINAPAINWPPDMESYDVNSKENIDKTIAPLGGSKTFTYSFIASKSGKYTLPPVKMSYFDPAARIYKTIETDPVSIQINNSKKKKHTNIAAVPSRQSRHRLDKIRVVGRRHFWCL